MAIARIFSAFSSPSNFFRFGASSESAETTGRIIREFLRRLWSFDSSDDPNQTTDESNQPSPSYAENPMEMEAGSPTEQDSRAVRKLHATGSLTVATLCCGIFASIPPTVQLDPHPPRLYNTLIAFVSLGVFTSVGLFVHSFVRPEGADYTLVGKNLMVIAIVFFLIAFMLRIALLLPVASFLYVWLVFFFVAAAIFLYLYSDRKKEHHNQTAHLLPISRGN